VTRIISWNVNGLRSVHRKGFLDWLGRSEAEIVGLQEVRARVEQLPPDLIAPSGWSAHIVAATRPGYSGVAVYARRPPDEVQSSLGVRELDAEGRVVMARFGRLTVVNPLFTKGSGSHR
jgi:exodeoxyribonuclease-3